MSYALCCYNHLYQPIPTVHIQCWKICSVYIFYPSIFLCLTYYGQLYQHSTSWEKENATEVWIAHWSP